MPEGDTIYKVAHYMAPQLVGHELLAVHMLGAPLPTLSRRTVTAVYPMGKHVIIALTPNDQDAWLIRVHLGMHGTWHSYPKQARWQRPYASASIIMVRADGTQFVCFDAEDMDCCQQHAMGPDHILRQLGPDLLAEKFDEAGVRQAIARIPATSLVIDILLNQRIAAGLGNVYKSELLFLHGLHPLIRKSAISADALFRIFADGRLWLQRNIGGWSRTLTYDRSQQPDEPARPRYYVYLRHHAPCLRCATPIARAVWGRHQRSCYWCPTCQPEL